MKIERIKEALEQAKNGLERYLPEAKEQIKWQETIIWALEEQIPKKPVKCILESPIKIGNIRFGEDTEILSKCPVCDNWVNGDYCDDCGQRLDWSDDE